MNPTGGPFGPPGGRRWPPVAATEERPPRSGHRGAATEERPPQPSAATEAIGGPRAGPRWPANSTHSQCAEFGGRRPLLGGRSSVAGPRWRPPVATGGQRGARRAPRWCSKPHPAPRLRAEECHMTLNVTGARPFRFDLYSICILISFSSNSFHPYLIVMMRITMIPSPQTLFPMHGCQYAVSCADPCFIR